MTALGCTIAATNRFLLLYNATEIIKIVLQIPPSPAHSCMLRFIVSLSFEFFAHAQLPSPLKCITQLNMNVLVMQRNKHNWSHHQTYPENKQRKNKDINVELRAATLSSVLTYSAVKRQIQSGVIKYD